METGFLFFLVTPFFLSSSLSLLKEREKGTAARIRAPGQCSTSMCSALSLFLSLPFSFLPFHNSLPSLILLFALWSVSKLPFSLSVSTTFTLFLLIFSPPPRKVNALQESPPHTHTFKKKKEKQTALHKHSSNPTALSAVSF